MIFCYNQEIFKTRDRVKKFVCPIGKGILKNPVFTKCGHLFCEECIVVYLNFESSKKDNDNNAPNSLTFENINLQPTSYERSQNNSYLQDNDNSYSEEEYVEQIIEKNCPICKTNINIDSLVKAYVVNNFLNEEQIICPNHCGWEGQLHHLPTHKKENENCSVQKINELQNLLKEKNDLINKMEKELEELKYNISKKQTFLINCSNLSNQSDNCFIIENALKMKVPFGLQFILKESKSKFEIGIYDSQYGFFLIMDNEGKIRSNIIPENLSIEIIFGISPICDITFNMKINEENELIVEIFKDHKKMIEKVSCIKNNLQNLKFYSYINKFD